jgi:hypothetical protein
MQPRSDYIAAIDPFAYTRPVLREMLMLTCRAQSIGEPMTKELLALFDRRLITIDPDTMLPISLH